MRALLLLHFNRRIEHAQPPSSENPLSQTVNYTVAITQTISGVPSAQLALYRYTCLVSNDPSQLKSDEFISSHVAITPSKSAERWSAKGSLSGLTLVADDADRCAECDGLHAGRDCSRFDQDIVHFLLHIQRLPSNHRFIEPSRDDRELFVRLGFQRWQGLLFCQLHRAE